MATRRTAAAPAETAPVEWQIPANVTAPPNNNANESDDDDDDIAQQLRAALAALPGDNIRIALYRRDARSRALEWCADYSPPQFDGGAFDLIRDEWGAGAFELRAIGPRGLVTRLHLNIATKSPAVRQESAIATQLQTVLAKFAEGQAAILAALTNKPDPMAQLRDTIALMVSLRELNPPPPPAPPASSLTDIVTAIKELRGAAAEILPERETKSDLQSMLEAVGPVVEIVKQQMAQRAQPVVAGVTLPPSIAAAPVPAIAAPAPSPPPVVATDEWIRRFQESTPEQQGESVKVLQKALDDLIAMAKAGKTTDDGADFIAEHLPDELIDFLEMPTWFDILSGFVPQVRDHEAWLRECVAKLDEPGPEVDALP